MNATHPNRPVTPTGSSFVSTDGSRCRYYEAQDGTRWICIEDGVSVRWMQVLVTTK